MTAIPPVARSTKKKDADAPRGLFRHSSGGWAIRFTCGAGHIHEEKVGPIKGDAVRAHAARRQKAYSQPDWCPTAEKRQARAQAALDAQKVRQRISFKAYAGQYLAWAQHHQRS